MEPETRSALQGEVVHFHVPGDTALLALVRTNCVAAAALVIDGYDRLHDLRLAIEELAVVLIEHAAPGARLGVGVDLADDTVRIEASIATRPGGDAPPRPSEVAAMVVSAVTDRWEITTEGRTATARLWMSGDRRN